MLQCQISFINFKLLNRYGKLTNRIHVTYKVADEIIYFVLAEAPSHIGQDLMQAEQSK